MAYRGKKQNLSWRSVQYLPQNPSGEREDTLTLTLQKYISRDGSNPFICICGMLYTHPQEILDILSNSKCVLSETRWISGLYGMNHSCGLVNPIGKMDCNFFGISSKEAHYSCPMLGPLLETVTECILDSGLKLKDVSRHRTGFYLGASFCDTDCLKTNDTTSTSQFFNTRSELCARISQQFDLKGPVMQIDGACASSFAVIHAALNDLQTKRCDLAIVVGANLVLDPTVSLQFAKMNMLSTTGKSTPFDEDANGYVRSDGIVAILLKPSTSTIFTRAYCDIVGFGLKCDGARVQGIIHPNHRIQSELLDEIYTKYNIDFNDIIYFEAHGTSTQKGDRAELTAINNTICSGRRDKLVVGSFKGNIGHTEASAGLAGIVKVIASFRANKIFCNINFHRPNSSISAFKSGKIMIPTQQYELPSDRSGVVGVNSFGFGGLVGHVVLRRCMTPVDKDDLTLLVPPSILIPLTLHPNVYATQAENEFKASMRDMGFYKFFLNSELSQGIANIQRSFIIAHPGNGSVMFSQSFNPGMSVKQVCIIFADFFMTPWSPNRNILNITSVSHSFGRIGQMYRDVNGLGNIQDTLRNGTIPNLVDPGGFVLRVVCQIAIVDLMMEVGALCHVHTITAEGIGVLAAAYADSCLSWQQVVKVALIIEKILFQENSKLDASEVTSHTDTQCPMYTLALQKRKSYLLESLQTVIIHPVLWSARVDILGMKPRGNSLMPCSASFFVGHLTRKTIELFEDNKKQADVTNLKFSHYSTFPSSSKALHLSSPSSNGSRETLHDSLSLASRTQDDTGHQLCRNSTVSSDLRDGEWMFDEKVGVGPVPKERETIFLSCFGHRSSAPIKECHTQCKDTANAKFDDVPSTLHNVEAHDGVIHLAPNSTGFLKAIGMIHSAGYSIHAERQLPEIPEAMTFYCGQFPTHLLWTWDHSAQSELMDWRKKQRFPKPKNIFEETYSSDLYPPHAVEGMGLIRPMLKLLQSFLAMELSQGKVLEINDVKINNGIFDDLDMSQLNEVHGRVFSGSQKFYIERVGHVCLQGTFAVYKQNPFSEGNSLLSTCCEIPLNQPEKLLKDVVATGLLLFGQIWPFRLIWDPFYHLCIIGNEVNSETLMQKTLLCSADLNSGLVKCGGFILQVLPQKAYATARTHGSAQSDGIESSRKDRTSRHRQSLLHDISSAPLNKYENLCENTNANVKCPNLIYSAPCRNVYTRQRKNQKQVRFSPASKEKESMVEMEVSLIPHPSEQTFMFGPGLHGDQMITHKVVSAQKTYSDIHPQTEYFHSMSRGFEDADDGKRALALALRMVKAENYEYFTSLELGTDLNEYLRNLLFSFPMGSSLHAYITRKMSLTSESPYVVYLYRNFAPSPSKSPGQNVSILLRDRNTDLLDRCYCISTALSIISSFVEDLYTGYEMRVFVITEVEGEEQSPISSWEITLFNKEMEMLDHVYTHGTTVPLEHSLAPNPDDTDPFPPNRNNDDKMLKMPSSRCDVARKNTSFSLAIDDVFVKTLGKVLAINEHIVAFAVLKDNDSGICVYAPSLPEHSKTPTVALSEQALGTPLSSSESGTEMFGDSKGPADVLADQSSGSQRENFSDVSDGKRMNEDLPKQIYSPFFISIRKTGQKSALKCYLYHQSTKEIDYFQDLNGLVQNLHCRYPGISKTHDVLVSKFSDRENSFDETLFNFWEKPRLDLSNREKTVINSSVRNEPLFAKTNINNFKADEPGNETLVMTEPVSSTKLSCSAFSAIKDGKASDGNESLLRALKVGADLTQGTLSSFETVSPKCPTKRGTHEHQRNIHSLSNPKSDQVASNTHWNEIRQHSTLAETGVKEDSSKDNKDKEVPTILDHSLHVDENVKIINSEESSDSSSYATSSDVLSSELSLNRYSPSSSGATDMELSSITSPTTTSCYNAQIFERPVDSSLPTFASMTTNNVVGNNMLLELEEFVVETVLVIHLFDKKMPFSQQQGQTAGNLLLYVSRPLGVATPKYLGMILDWEQAPLHRRFLVNENFDLDHLKNTLNIMYSLCILEHLGRMDKSTANEKTLLVQPPIYRDSAVLMLVADHIGCGSVITSSNIPAVAEDLEAMIPSCSVLSRPIHKLNVLPLTRGRGCDIVIMFKPCDMKEYVELVGMCGTLVLCGPVDPLQNIGMESFLRNITICSVDARHMLHHCLTLPEAEHLRFEAMLSSSLSALSSKITREYPSGREGFFHVTLASVMEIPVDYQPNERSLVQSFMCCACSSADHVQETSEKKGPVIDYLHGVMSWTIEEDYPSTSPAFLDVEDAATASGEKMEERCASPLTLNMLPPLARDLTGISRGDHEVISPRVKMVSCSIGPDLSPSSCQDCENSPTKIKEIPVLFSRGFQSPELKESGFVGADQVVVPLNKCTTGTPLCIVHPIMGTVKCLIKLAALLQRPVFGLQYTRQAQIISEAGIQVLARFYLQSLEQSFPKGFISLAGYSFGCAIAWEMARSPGLNLKIQEVIFIEGSPDYVQAHIQHELTFVPREGSLRMRFECAVLLSFVRLYLANISYESLAAVLMAQECLSQKIEMAVDVSLGYTQVGIELNVRERWRLVSEWLKKKQRLASFRRQIVSRRSTSLSCSECRKSVSVAVAGDPQDVVEHGGCGVEEDDFDVFVKEETVPVGCAGSSWQDRNLGSQTKVVHQHPCVEAKERIPELFMAEPACSLRDTGDRVMYSVRTQKAQLFLRLGVLMYEYKPRPMAGKPCTPCTLIRVRDPPAYLAAQGLDIHYGLGHLVDSDHLKVIFTEGGHHSILQHPAVEALAQIIQNL